METVSTVSSSWSRTKKKIPKKGSTMNMNGKAQRSAPWIALATAAIVPFFSYLESSKQAEAVEVMAKNQSQKNQETTKAVYTTAAKTTEKLQADITACHQRVDKLAEALVDLAVARRRTLEVPGPVMEQRAISRPNYDEMPKRKAEVSRGNPLFDVLE